LQSARSLPWPPSSISRIGMTVSMPQIQTARPGVILDADRADLELTVFCFQDDAVLILRLEVVDFS